MNLRVWNLSVEQVQASEEGLLTDRDAQQILAGLLHVGSSYMEERSAMSVGTNCASREAKAGPPAQERMEALSDSLCLGAWTCGCPGYLVPPRVEVPSAGTAVKQSRSSLFLLHGVSKLRPVKKLSLAHDGRVLRTFY
jgi:hypothetical protein